MFPNWSFLLPAFIFIVCLKWQGVDAECENEHLGLFYIENHQIFHISSGYSKLKEVISTEEFGLRPILLTYNHFRKNVIFIDQWRQNRMYSYNMVTGTLLYFGSINMPIRSIAIDTSSGNVYYVGSDNNIYMCNLMKAKCAQVMSSETSTRYNLILHSKRGMMFWIERNLWSQTLMVASMNGQNIRPINSLKNVYSIALDSKNDLLYVAYLDSIVQFDLLTMERKKLASASVLSLFYANCKLFCIERNTKSEYIYHLDGRNETIGHSNSNVLHMSTEGLSEVIENPCKEFECDDGLCVVAENRPWVEVQCLRNTTFSINKVIVKEEDSFPVWPFMFFFVFLGLILFSHRNQTAA